MAKVHIEKTDQSPGLLQKSIEYGVLFVLICDMAGLRNRIKYPAQLKEAACEKLTEFTVFSIGKDPPSRFLPYF